MVKGLVLPVVAARSVTIALAGGCLIEALQLYLCALSDGNPDEAQLYVQVYRAWRGRSAHSFYSHWVGKPQGNNARSTPRTQMIALELVETSGHEPTYIYIGLFEPSAITSGA